MPRSTTNGSTAGTSEPQAGTAGGRPRGRPRLDIDPDAVADAVAELFAEGGYEAVSIADTATKLSVSRSTLYRTVPTKEDLLGILFERGTRELTEGAQKVLAEHPGDPRQQLRELVTLQVHAAVRMRDYMGVFFGGGNLPPEVYRRWRVWARDYEKMWNGVVAAAMDAGVLEPANPVLTTRLLLGMCIWVSRWYRPNGPYVPDDIADVALRLLRIGAEPGVDRPPRT